MQPLQALGGASVLLAVFGALSAWGFYLIGEVCARTANDGGSSGVDVDVSYAAAWRATLGPSSAWIPSAASLLLCFTASVACATVIGDTATDLIAGALDVPYATMPRNGILLAITALVLLPLCLLRSLAPLSAASLLGVAGAIVSAVAMLVRLVDGSYSVDSGAFVSMIPWQPAFAVAHLAHAPEAATAAASSVASSMASSSSGGLLAGSLMGSLMGGGSVATSVATRIATGATAADMAAAGAAVPPVPLGGLGLSSVGGSGGSGGLLDALSVAAGGSSDDPSSSESVLARLPTAGSLGFFVSLLSNAYLAHYNAPILFAEIQPGSESEGGGGNISSKLDAFRVVVLTGFVASGALFVAITATSFATFGSVSQPIILNNYASADVLAALARCGIGLCVLFEFPLLERPFRRTIAELVLDDAQAASSVASSRWAGVLSVASIVSVAIAGVPLDTLAAISGGTGGALLIYIAPALMSLRLRQAVQADKEGGAAMSTNPNVSGDLDLRKKGEAATAFALVRERLMPPRPSAEVPKPMVPMVAEPMLDMPEPSNERQSPRSIMGGTSTPGGALETELEVLSLQLFALAGVALGGLGTYEALRDLDPIL